jgi:hypothetical protein
VHVRSADLKRRIKRALGIRSSLGTRDEISGAFLDLLAELPVGKPFSFREQYGGALVQDVRPAQNRDDEVSSRGRVALGPHTDDVFLDPEMRPEHIALLGISNPAGIPTLLVPLEDVLSELESATIETLTKPLFTFGCPPSFDIDANIRASLRTPPRPILRPLPDGGFEVGFPASTTEPVDGAGKDVATHLQLWRQAVKRAPSNPVVLEAGDVLVFSNSRCLHGRPVVDEADRWLKRVYLRYGLFDLERWAGTDSTGVFSAVEAFRHSRRRTY